MIVALTRVPRGQGKGADASIIRALATDLGVSEGFDPLDCNMGEPWSGAKPDALVAVSGDVWRIIGDTVERLELLASALVSGTAPATDWGATIAVLNEINTRVRPSVQACGPAEITALLAGLAGQFVAPGPAGAPTRGRLATLPTGRSF